MKKMISLLLCLLLPLCAMAAELPAAPEGMRWVSLQEDYAMLVPELLSVAQQDPEQQDGIYYMAVTPDAQKGVFLAISPQSAELLCETLLANNAEEVSEHGIAGPADMRLFLEVADGMEGLYAIFAKAEGEGAHMVYMLAPDIEAWVEEAGEDCLESLMIP